MVLPALFYPHSEAFALPDNLNLLSSSLGGGGKIETINNVMPFTFEEKTELKDL